MRVPGRKFFVPASVNSASSLLESYKEARGPLRQAQDRHGPLLQTRHPRGLSTRKNKPAERRVCFFD
jgi:hypothetical protein